MGVEGRMRLEGFNHHLSSFSNILIKEYLILASPRMTDKHVER